MNNRSRAARDQRELQKEILEPEACPRLIDYCRLVAQRKRAMFLNEQYWGKAVPSFGDPNTELVIIGLAPAAHGETGLEGLSLEIVPATFFSTRSMKPDLLDH